MLDDPDLATWQQYGVKGWPTLVVIDPEGYVVGGIAGEGSGAVVFAAVERPSTEHDAKGTLARGAVAGDVGLGAAGRRRAQGRHLSRPASRSTGTGRRLA